MCDGVCGVCVCVTVPVVCLQGDTVEELCDPDFQEELDGLRKLREVHALF